MEPTSSHRQAPPRFLNDNGTRRPLSSRSLGHDRSPKQRGPMLRNLHQHQLPNSQSMTPLPRSSSKENASNVSTPRNALPNSPLTLLKKEMDSCMEEEPLLFSPVSHKLPPRSGTVGKRSSAFAQQQHNTANNTSTQKFREQSIEAAENTTKVMENEPVHPNRPSFATSPKPLSTNLKHQPTKTTSSASILKLPPLKPYHEARRGVQKKVKREDESTDRPPSSSRPMKTVAKPRTAQQIERKVQNTADSTAEWSATRASLSVLHPNTPSSTPFAQRGGSPVCMDLSDIFYDAAKKNSTNRKPPRPIAPSTKRVQRRVENTPESTSSTVTQVQTFTNWLNFLFSSGEEEDYDHEDMAHRGLILQQRLAQERLLATQLFEGASIRQVRDVIWTQITKHRIELRKDRDLSANLHHRREIMGLLFSYSLRWLRLGLETMFRVTIQPKASKLRVALKNFIIDHVLKDDRILAKYTGGRCNVPSGAFEEKYRAEIQEVVLHRLLVLFFFLDRAKQSRLIEDMLFVRSSKAKSTKDILLAFCREFLRAEGNFVKHLSRVGLQVHCEQHALDELDFTVTNLRVDLNDGVRLTRMAEILTGDASLLRQLRVPAVSRLQKFHNVGIALDALVGIPLDGIQAYHIVDGHRTKVLQLLWSVLAHCCLPELLPINHVLEEIGRIQKLHCISNGPVASTESLSVALLQWSRLICSLFQYDVADLTASFGDGIAICYLIHYYHPTLLVSRDIQLSKNAWHLAQEKMLLLGGVPEMIPAPEQKSMILCLSFLCARLMDTGLFVRASLVLQRSYRKYQARILWRRQCVAGRFLWRAWKQHRVAYYKQQRSRYGEAVLCIETFVRENWSSLEHIRRLRLNQERYLKATVCLQSQVRMWLSQKERNRRDVLLRSAIDVQSCWRGFVTRRIYRRFLHRVHSATVIQTAYRRFSQFWEKRHEAATTIQKVVRMRACRLDYLIDVLDIVAVQNCIRRRLATWRYQRIRASCVEIQCLFRYALARRRSQYLKEDRSAIRLQCWVRQVQTRSAWKALLECAVKIQAHWRSCQAKILLVCLRNERQTICAAVSIQSFARVYFAKVILDVKREENRMLRATVTIQSLWRQHLAVQTLQFLRWKMARSQAAVCIQAFFRMVEAQFLLSKLKDQDQRRKAATVVQAKWRSNLERDRFATAVSRIVQSQACARQVMQRQHYIRVRYRISTIQAWWRAETMRIKYLRFYNQVVFCQASIRRFLSILSVAKRRAAVLTLQCSFRCELASRELASLRKDYALREYASLVVQRYWRGSNASQKYQVIRADIILLQTRLRIALSKIQAEARRNAIAVIQCSARCAMARRARWRQLAARRAVEKARIKAATLLQASYRGVSVRTSIMNQHVSAVLIQKSFRRFFQWASFQLTLTDTVVVQSLVRSFLARKELRRRIVAKIDHEERRRVASVVIQSLFRGMIVRIRLREQNEAAVCIQSAYRGFAQSMEYRWDRADIILVQSLVRGRIACKSATSRACAVIQIQCSVRCCLARRESRSRLIAFLRAIREALASIVIQRHIRGARDRKRALEERSARAIQKTWRCYTVHLDYMIYILSAVTIQSAFRQSMAMTEARSQSTALLTIRRFCAFSVRKVREDRRNRAATRLQCNVRMLQCRTRYTERVLLETSARAIQASFRMFTCRREFSQILSAAVSIQRVFRGFFARIHMEALDFCAIEGQRMWRGFTARKSFEKVRLSTIALQSLFRRIAGQRHVKKLREKRAAKVIELFVHHVRERRAYIKLRKTVIKLQSRFRAFRVRRRSSRDVKARAKRMAKVNHRATRHPELQIGNRTKYALSILLKSRSLSEIMEAVWILELSTRLSKRSCVDFCRVGSFDVLFSLIQTCNRSLPHLKLVCGALLTMTNVVRSQELVHFMLSEQGVEVLLDLLQMFRDKEYVFCLVVPLIDLAVRTDPNMKMICRSRENMKRLHSVRDLCQRKQTTRQPSLGFALGLPTGMLRCSYKPNFSGRTRQLDRMVRFLDPK